MQRNLKKELNNARFIQLLITYIIGLVVYRFTTIPHGWWIFLTVILMMAALQPGLILVKSIHRGKGTIVGIIIAFMLVYVLHINYRLVSLVLILSMIMLNVPNSRRYDIVVIFMTVMIFITDAYNFNEPLIEGPLEVAINRVTCTFIGISICILVDYLLFNKYDYSKKAYSVLQKELLDTLELRVIEILMHEDSRLTKLVLLKKMRDSFNEIFSEISLSASGILNSNNSAETKRLVSEFSEISWKLRTEVSAIYVTTCKIKDPESCDKHIARYNRLKKEGQRLLLKI